MHAWVIARRLRTIRAVMSVVIALVGVHGCASSRPAPDYILEKPAFRISGDPEPTYPPELLATRDTGTVIIRVVVSAKGRAEMGTAEVIASPHPAFTRAALAVIPRYRFVPAEVGGAFGRCYPPEKPTVCEAGRPGKKVPMPVDLAFVFRVPAAAEPPARDPDSLAIPATLPAACRSLEGVEAFDVRRATETSVSVPSSSRAELVVHVRLGTGGFPPVAGAGVYVEPDSGMPGSRSRNTGAMTDDSGRATVGGLFPLRYRIAIRRVGYEPLNRTVDLRAGYIDTVHATIARHRCDPPSP